MAAGAEADQLIGIAYVGTAFKVLLLQALYIYQHFLRSRFACERRNRFASYDCFRLGYYAIGHGSTFQISAAYSAIVRSLENFPELATFRIALRAHASGSAYRAPSSSCAWQ